MTRAHRESRRKKDIPHLQKPSKWPSRPLKPKRRPSWLLQLQGCHFCTKGCQNPRARGSQGAVARELPGLTALETRDPATKRPSITKISEVRESAADPPGRSKMGAKQTACYHCKTLLSLPKEHSKYWRCGHCRKVNGRPNYARGFVPGLLYCGLCRFYFSRITHAVATTALVGMVGSGVSLFFTDDLARLRLAALAVRTVSLVL